MGIAQNDGVLLIISVFVLGYGGGGGINGGWNEKVCCNV